MMIGGLMKLIGMVFLLTLLSCLFLSCGLLTVGFTGSVLLFMVAGLLLFFFFLLPFLLGAAVVVSVVAVGGILFFPVLPWLIVAAVVGLLCAFYCPRSYREVSFD